MLSLCQLLKKYSSSSPLPLQGVLTAFGSYCPRDGPAFQNSIIISICNSLFSFIAGFAVFAGLGYLAYHEGVELDKVAVSGPSLLFGAYPVVLATLPGGIHWVRLLFFTLFLLGIDSAFGLVDAVITVTADSVPGANFSKRQIVSGWCILGFLIGLIYATDAGFRFLDVFDFYINFLVVSVFNTYLIRHEFLDTSFTHSLTLMDICIFEYDRLLWDCLNVLQ
jgi:solute carrier family 6 GABA transporter-like protein 1